MPAYVIAMIEVKNQEGYGRYAKEAPVATAKFGGHAIARGPAVVTFEGSDSPKRVVVLEFPSAEKAKGWFDSPEYQAARKHRLGAADFRMFLVDGV